jgi:hypothetical protein
LRVKAFQKGYDNIKEREVGEEFDWPHSYPCSWANPVSAKPASDKAGKAGKSEIPGDVPVGSVKDDPVVEGASAASESVADAAPAVAAEVPAKKGSPKKNSSKRASDKSVV